MKHSIHTFALTLTVLALAACGGTTQQSAALDETRMQNPTTCADFAALAKPGGDPTTLFGFTVRLVELPCAETVLMQVAQNHANSTYSNYWRIHELPYGKAVLDLALAELERHPSAGLTAIMKPDYDTSKYPDVSPTVGRMLADYARTDPFNTMEYCGHPLAAKHCTFALFQSYLQRLERKDPQQLAMRVSSMPPAMREQFAASSPLGKLLVDLQARLDAHTKRFGPDATERIPVDRMQLLSPYAASRAMSAAELEDLAWDDARTERATKELLTRFRPAPSDRSDYIMNLESLERGFEASAKATALNHYVQSKRRAG